MDKAEAVAGLLRSASRDTLCPVCIAFAVALSLDEARSVLRRLAVDSRDIASTGGRCAGCGRETEVYGVNGQTNPRGSK